MTLRGVAFAVSLLCTLAALSIFGSVAHAAADSGTDAGSDLATLEKQLDDESSALSTADCNEACRALASIHRAVERICSLEPGPRCAAARTKSEEATRRVREACPDCTIGAPMTRIGREQPDALRSAESMPAAGESTRGGCRSCSAISATGSFPDLAWVAALAWLAARTRRRKPPAP